MKIFTSANQKRGELGESVACRFLLDRGFSVIERNYTRKWGEIDIIALRGGMLHFIEVKSVSRENIDDISHETAGLRPEDQMHSHKQGRLKRMIETYIAEHKTNAWQFDLLCVYIDEKCKKARVKVMGDLVL
ncbi:MAG: YraN family protein [Candidatus Taylorbacteria bacterium]|nr:YraN family protein [Candidatus Taylorbacteria bacterium]